jgi:hypothetical protein
MNIEDIVKLMGAVYIADIMGRFIYYIARETPATEIDVKRRAATTNLDIQISEARNMDRIGALASELGYVPNNDTRVWVKRDKK